MTEPNPLVEVMQEDYMVDALGRRIPRRLVKDIDIARDALVRDIVERAQEQHDKLTAFKSRAMGDIEAFVELSAEQYGVSLGGQKGNVTLMSYDGRYKVIRQISEHIVFDERLQVAKALIDACIREWSAGSSDELRVLVEDAFQVNKEGKISTGRVLGLRRLNITGTRWLEAMRAIPEL